jgi:Zn-dependent alcohol dehydrogenase
VTGLPALPPRAHQKKYPLEEINEGYADLMDGKNIRGVIVGQR